MRIDALRARYGLGAFSYTDPTIATGVTVVRATHIIQMRQALLDAYNAAGSTPPSYSTTPAAGVPIRLADIAELRYAVQILE